MRAALIITGIVATIGSNALAEDAAVRSHPIEECLEAGEFIRNAALSRDNGISREFFLARLEEDLVAIRSFPPHLRWFVRNELDEALLTGAAERVFDVPQPPRRHEIEFVDECMQSPGWRLESVDFGPAPQQAISAVR
ncbi:MAG: hypothetical protein JSU95_19665 [Betaproteobacteria bacterium]|nr:MAG: hypothetical protein JSU95_19665 [Betaproteobacteria bacterium]